MSVTLTEYAVRVVGTQCYLPRPQRSDGRGGSHLGPVDFSKPPGERGFKSRYEQNMQIRSFSTPGAAKNLMKAWYQGKWYSDYEGDMWSTSVPERKFIELEIVPITITLPF